MTPNSDLITADRDCKIRVSRYPESYVIKSFCLGHEEYVLLIHACFIQWRFISRVALLSVPEQRIVSAAGDGTIRLWAMDGKQLRLWVAADVPMLSLTSFRIRILLLSLKKIMRIASLSSE